MSEDSPSDSQGKMIVFGAKQIRRIWHEEQWFFSIVDIVAALTDSDAPSKYWTAMKRREEAASGTQLSTLCRQLKLASSDGKSYRTDCVNTEAAFRRDHMTDLELIFTMLGEAATTEIARNRDAQGFMKNKLAARAGGSVAGNARRQLEARSGRKVVTRRNYLTNKPKPPLPPPAGKE